LSIAAKDDLLADALMYFARGDDWFDVCKALETLALPIPSRLAISVAPKPSSLNAATDAASIDAGRLKLCRVLPDPDPTPNNILAPDS
jgi:hypothetical protein